MLLQLTPAVARETTRASRAKTADKSSVHVQPNMRKYSHQQVMHTQLSRARGLLFASSLRLECCWHCPDRWPFGPPAEQRDFAGWERWVHLSDPGADSGFFEPLVAAINKQVHSAATCPSMHTCISQHMFVSSFHVYKLPTLQPTIAVTQTASSKHACALVSGCAKDALCPTYAT